MRNFVSRLDCFNKWCLLLKFSRLAIEMNLILEVSVLAILSGETGTTWVRVHPREGPDLARGGKEAGCQPRTTTPAAFTVALSNVCL